MHAQVYDADTCELVESVMNLDNVETGSSLDSVYCSWRNVAARRSAYS